MDISSQLVPAVVILVANLLSGPNFSLRYERVTAVFGITALVALVVWIFIAAFAVAQPASPYLLQVVGFCLIAALSRDYERILRPLFPWNR